MNNLVRKLFTMPVLPELWLNLLRVLTGALLVYHGSSKVFGGLGNLAAELAERGWPLPEFQAFAAAYIEFAGGILLVVGLFTRPAALAVVIQFAVLVFVFYAGDPFGKLEKALMFLALATYLFLVGPGKISVDYFLFKQTEAPLPAGPEGQSPVEQPTLTDIE
jgi:putative oxidoreductase